MPRPCDPPAHAGEDISEEQRSAWQEKVLAHPRRRRGIAHRGLPVSPPSIARSSPPTSSTLCTVLMLLKYQNCHTGRTVEVPRTAHTTAIVDIFFIRRLQCADESGASSGYKHVDGGLSVSIGAALLFFSAACRHACQLGRRCERQPPHHQVQGAVRQRVLDVLRDCLSHATRPDSA